MIRVAHPDYADGLAYAKPAGVSLRRGRINDLVITASPLAGCCTKRSHERRHQMNREILRLRADVNCFIHRTTTKDCASCRRLREVKATR